jgi:DNA-binding transcriptional LysR family regulator
MRDVRAFYEVAQQTRLRIVQEALSGTWEALLDRRVDLLVGAPGDGPAGGGYVSEPIGTIASCSRWRRASAGRRGGKLGRTQLQQHRAVAWPTRRARWRRARSACCWGRIR